MTLFIALNEIREKQDPSLQFDFVCRAGICGSCGMMINGRPSLSSPYRDWELGTETTLAAAGVRTDRRPVGEHRQVDARDERATADMGARKQDEVDMTRIEQPMDADLAEKIYELDRCIECGCCVLVAAPAHAQGFRRRRGSEQDRALLTRAMRAPTRITTS